MKRAGCLLLAAAALAAGCGASDDGRLAKSEYEATLRAALARPLVVEHSPPNAAIDSLDAVATRFGDIASRLSGVQAPADVQVFNDGLVAGAAKFSTALRALIRRLRSAPEEKRNRMLAELDTDHLPGLVQFDRATAGLAAKGYAFSPNGGT